MSLLRLLAFIVMLPFPAMCSYESVARHYHFHLSPQEQADYIRLFGREKKYETTNVAVITVPKSGSFLIGKLVSLLTGKEMYHQLRLSPDHFLLIHFDYHERKSLMLEDQNIKKILNIRDPRKVAISMVHWLPKMKSCDGEGEPIDPAVYNLWNASSINKKISLMLTSDHCPIGYIKKNTREAMLLSNRSDIYVNRFEDLCGSYKGGNDLLQKETIHKIASFLDISLVQEQVDFLAKVLVGNSVTFRLNDPSDKTLFTKLHEQELHLDFDDVLDFFGYQEG